MPPGLAASSMSSKLLCKHEATCQDLIQEAAPAGGISEMSTPVTSFSWRHMQHAHLGEQAPPGPVLTAQVDNIWTINVLIHDAQPLQLQGSN